MTLPKNFNPEMLDYGPNVSNNRFFEHDFEIDCRVAQCRNAAHHRLLDLKTETEVRDTVERIDAMRELWHGE
jgi:hypothetical protein